jgi:hypothetical protein
LSISLSRMAVPTNISLNARSHDHRTHPTIAKTQRLCLVSDIINSNQKKTVSEQIFGGFAGALLCTTLLLSVAMLAGSVDARLQAAESSCGVRIHQFQDAAWLCYLAVTTFGLTGWAIARKCGFYPRVCRMCFVANSLVSLTSLVLVGNN